MKASELSNPKPVVLKIGGSVITDKNEEMKANTQVINRLATEIKEANVENLLIVHGGGSFGHPAAKRYNIKEGLKEDSQKIGFTQTHHFMTVLNGLVMDSLIWHEVLAVSIPPSTLMITRNGRIQSFENAQIRKLLAMGFLPVLYGDAVLDSELGFTILSGDQLVAKLAMHLNACRIIIGVDVDGLYDNDPKTGKNAKIYRYLTLTELKKLHGSIERPMASDVTGGMYGKIAELIPAVESGIPVTIVNAAKPNNICMALKGEKVEGTLIEKE
ncbi:MAG: isopentenyl phosphate kinase [Candidatus Bathyarchaeota archaeon]|jgi:isopentenyl phosphate kinase|nr:isopentenyl phosphate kinase [Candidatus Bathyarchaeota archaeon]